jgi:hypothetical protein
MSLFFDKASTCNSNESFASLLQQVPRSSLSVIDGMQRTAALDLAVKDGESESSFHQ